MIFTNYDKFIKHINKDTHQDFNNYNKLKCDLCEQTFPALDGLRLNYLKHIQDNIIKKPLQCIINNCSYKIETATAFGSHWRREHRLANQTMLRRDFYEGHETPICNEISSNDFDNEYGAYNFDSQGNIQTFGPILYM